MTVKNDAVKGTLSIMLKENISLTQLFTLIVNLLLGSSIIVGIGIDAQQNGWIAVIIATFLGCGLMFFYFSLNGLLPNKNLYEIMEYCFTRKVTIVLSSLYVMYFLYICSRVLRSFAEMIAAAIMPHTPMEVILFSFLCLLSYILYLGLEVLGRISEIFSPYIYLFLLFLMIFLPLSGAVHLNNLFPILGDGVQPVIKSIFPSMLVFPFGELIVFTVILSSLRDIKKSWKWTFMAVLAAGLQLMFGSMLLIVSLGMDALQSSNFPVLSMVRLISVGEFIERLDPIAVFIIILGVLIKSALLLYCSLKGLEYIFRIPYRYFSFPISILTAVFTMFIAANYGEHLAKGGSAFIYRFHLVMQFLIPVITFIFLMRKTKKQKNLKGKQNGKSIHS